MYNEKKLSFYSIGLLTLLLAFVYVKHSIATGSLTKQTVYLWFINSFHHKDGHREPMFMLIDEAFSCMSS